VHVCTERLGYECGGKEVYLKLFVGRDRCIGVEAGVCYKGRDDCLVWRNRMWVWRARGVYLCVYVCRD